MADATVTLEFKWIQVSPDPHDVTMRNTLEPVDVFVLVEVPLKHEYIANSEPIIAVKLGVDGEKPQKPILTKEGMQYVINELSLQQKAILEPDVEEDWDDNEEWEGSSSSDEPVDNDEDFDWEEE